MKNLLLIGLLLTITGCASMAPYSTSGWKPGDNVAPMTLHDAATEIVMGKTRTSTGILVPVDPQTASVIKQLEAISYDDLKNMPPQTNEHSQALVLAEINLKSHAAADEAWRHNWCAQAGQSLGCLDNF